MKSPDTVFRELGQLYDFYGEIAKFRIDGKPEPNACRSSDDSRRDTESDPLTPAPLPLGEGQG